MIGKFNDETSFSHKLLLTDTKVSKIRKDFANASWINVKFSKTQLSKMMHEGGVLGEVLVVPYGALKTGTQELIKKHQN